MRPALEETANVCPKVILVPVSKKNLTSAVASGMLLFHMRKSPGKYML